MTVDEIPGWRRPCGVLSPCSYEYHVERHGLQGAIVDLLGSESRTRGEFAAAVREDWGDCTDAALGQALRELLRAGGIRRNAGRYSRTGDD